MRLTTKIALLGLMAVAPACGAEDSWQDGADPSTSDQPSADLQDKVVFDTIVEIGPDGKATSRREAILLSVRRAQEVERAALADAIARGVPVADAKLGSRSQAVSTNVSQDSGCGGASWWGYDGTNQSGNRLCLKTTDGTSGFGDLDDWCWRGSPCASWKGHIASVWTGEKHASLHRISGGAYQHVAPYTQANVSITPIDDLTLYCDNPNYPCSG
jgi:hypothetical protein